MDTLSLTHTHTHTRLVVIGSFALAARVARCEAEWQQTRQTDGGHRRCLKAEALFPLRGVDLEMNANRRMLSLTYCFSHKFTLLRPIM